MNSNTRDANIRLCGPTAADDRWSPQGPALPRRPPGLTRKPNGAKTWKEFCFACVDAEEFRLVQICGLNIIVQVDDLEEVSEYYQNRGCFNELIALMESGLGLECARMGIFTELGVLYARYCFEQLIEHIKLFSTCLNISGLR
ncbi:hypothetical protein GUJ93_ZPchr0005g14825 [Zizania palustris]|uniref:Uncharacterized protein n=1 Tax=Zizania palustris TaxID=103762 RepID=A0A8J5SCT4_ZIZPA|nr:hypothetical protein GUJ93_ZPchr0005g14825 [Zizania palustris]